MKTKHTPATPLPWSAARMIEGRDKRIQDQTAELIRLRADRAKLVKALRDSISDLQTMERHYPESAKTVLERRRALLRSLGEDA